MNRNQGFQLKVFAFLVVCICTAVIFSGCRGLMGSDEETQVINVDTETLEGNVTMPDAANIVADEVSAEAPRADMRAAFLAGGANVPNALVWIEELPNVPPQRTTASGSYRFTGLPAGTYHIVAKYEQNGQTLMARSAPAQTQRSGSTPRTFPLQLALANKMITGTLLDSAGNPLPAGTIIRLWGEEFTVQAKGAFTAGPLPDSITDAELVIVQSGVALANLPRIPVQVLTTDRPTTIEVQIPGTGNQVPPIGVSFTAKRGGQPISSTNLAQTGDQVTITLTLINITPTATGITFEWDAGRGSFSPVPGNIDSAVWVAPSNGVATVSVKISAPNRGFCRVNLPIVVGSANVTNCTVTFDSQGGSAVSAATVAQGDKAAAPTAPARSGFTFAGWYREATCENLWNFGADTVSANMTLYAKWLAGTVQTFTVTFNSQGGSAVTAQSIAQGQKVPTPTPPTKATFSFAGWYKEAGCTNAWSFDTDAVTTNVTLFAKWVSGALPTFTLTYTAEANGSITGTTPQTVTQGANGTAVTATPGSGYRFVQWSDGSTANPRTDTNVSANKSVAATFAAIEGAISGDNKYAWSENSGWINFAPTNGGVGSRRGTNGYLNGLAWSESLGWIKFAATAAVAPFANSANNNWGVNVAADGTLSGYAWSENSGWINFGATGGNAAMNQTTGELSGFVWSESAGWIHLAGSGYKVQFGS